MTCAEHAYRGRRRCPACAELVEARADATGCEWCIPGDAKMEDMRGLRCVLGDGHDGPHVVGVSGEGYAMLWRVDAERRIATPMARASLRGEPPLTYAKLSAMAAIVMETREELAADG